MQRPLSCSLALMRIDHRRLLPGVLILLAYTLIAAESRAEEAGDKKGEAEAASAEAPAAPLVEEAETPAAAEGEDESEGEDEGEPLTLENLQQQIEADRQEKEEMKERLDTLEETQLEQMTRDQKALNVFGFVDLAWYKFMYKDNSAYQGELNSNNMFAVGHWNLYLEKQLGESFRVMGEVRFLYNPYGQRINFDTRIAGMETDYERAYTETWDYIDAYYYDWGGISIQRVWIEYKLSDYFAVRAGHFLTPYGVWNVDHASTVVIPVHRPFLNTAELMPESQTGLYLFGRAFPSGSTAIDYGLTISNGRGPVQKLFDLDENKALGLDLAFSYDGPVSLSLGTYLFWGKSTDTIDVFEADENFVWVFSKEFVSQYWEKSMSFHLKFEWAGLLLQGEYARGLIHYTNDGRPYLYDDFVTGLPMYATDYIQEGAYALVAYKLPLDAVSLTPYFIYEYQHPDDKVGHPYGNNYGGGLNWRILPPVVWKVEALYHQDGADLSYLPRRNYTLVSTQLAVSY
jgi:hypothetical protein